MRTTGRSRAPYANGPCKTKGNTRWQSRARAVPSTRMRKLARALIAAVIAAPLAVMAGIGAPSAHAADTWAAITWSPPEGVGGTGTGANQDEAIRRSVANCDGTKGTMCITVIFQQNT